MNKMIKSFTSKHPPTNFFTFKGIALPFLVADVLPSSLSESKIENNFLAAFIVQRALGENSIKSDEILQNSFTTHDGVRVSVGAITNLKVSRNKTSSDVFLEFIERKEKLQYYKELEADKSDIYIICELDEIKNADPTELNNWKFHVLEATVLKSLINKDSSEDIGSLLKKFAMKSDYQVLKKAVYMVIHSLQLSY